MEAFVQMSLETYDSLKRNNEYLKIKLKEEQESHNEDVVQAKKEINDLAEKIDHREKEIHRMEYFMNELKLIKKEIEDD